jgi:MFS family permease
MVIIYTLFTALFFFGLLYYLINYSLVPYNNENVLDIKNMIIVSVLFAICIALLFSFFHLIIDKLFFRKYYEKPKLLLALRRGLLLGFMLAGFTWLRVFDFWQWHLILLVFLLIVLFEALFITFERNIKESKKDKKDEIKNNS